MSASGGWRPYPGGRAAAPARRFQTTNWTVILRAGKDSPAAFAAFCEGYRGPVYWFILALGIPDVVNRQLIRWAQSLT